MGENRKDRIRAVIDGLANAPHYDATMVIEILVQALVGLEELDIPDYLRVRMDIAETIAINFTGDDGNPDQAYAELETLAGLLLNDRTN
jgi:hypothetical protein